MPKPHARALKGGAAPSQQLPASGSTTKVRQGFAAALQQLLSASAESKQDKTNGWNGGACKFGMFIHWGPIPYQREYTKASRSTDREWIMQMPNPDS